MKTFIQTVAVLGAMMLSVLKVSAYDFEADGMYYNIVSTLDFTCKVTSGDVKYSGDVAIPQTVTYKNRTLSVIGVGYQAFYNCSGLTSVTIPNSVTHIDESAFSGCSGLTSVTIPNSITKISKYAFYGCSGLTSVTIPNSVTHIDEYAFYGCSSLTSVTIPNSVTEIGWCAFYGCSGLTSVTIPNSVTEIGRSAFRDCSGLTSVTIPNSVTKIGKSAFRDCSGLTSVTIPNSVTYIDEYAFSGCSGLTSVTIPNSITRIYEYAFDGCSGLTSVTIPNSVTGIYYGAFRGCDSLETVIFEKGETKLSCLDMRRKEPAVFDKCSSIKNLTMGRYVYESPNYVCLGIRQIVNLTGLDGADIRTLMSESEETLKTLTLEKNVNWHIGDLSGYKSLETIILQEYNPIVCDNTFSNIQYTDITVYVPKGSLNAYQNADGWKKFWNIVEMDESGIDDITVDDGMRTEIGRYDLQGRKVSEDYKGMVIVRYSDGSVSKLIKR